MITALIILATILYLVIAAFTAYVLLLSYSLSHIGQPMEWYIYLGLILAGLFWWLVIPYAYLSGENL